MDTDKLKLAFLPGGYPLTRNEVVKVDNDERLLTVNFRRFVLFPIRYHAIWRAYKHVMSTVWSADGIDVSRDALEWKTRLTASQKHTASVLMTLLSGSQQLHQDLISTLSTDITVPEARCFFGFQFMIENVHREAMLKVAYELTGYKLDEGGFASKLLAPKLAFTKMMKERQLLIPFSERLLVSVFVQGVFNASLSFLFRWYCAADVLPGFTYTHDKIALDREAHVDFVSLLFYHVKRRPHSSYVSDVMKIMVGLEKSFAGELIKEMQIDMQISELHRHIEFTADILLRALGYCEHFNAKELLGCVHPGTLKSEYFTQEMASAYSAPTADDAVLDSQFALHSGDF